MDCQEVLRPHLSSRFLYKQILHATVLDIKVYYYPRNAVFHEAAGRVEYCHSEGSNEPDIQHSKSAIFVFIILITLAYKTVVRALKTETMHSSKTTLSYQQRNATVTIYTWLVPIHAFQNDDTASE